MPEDRKALEREAAKQLVNEIAAAMGRVQSRHDAALDEIRQMLDAMDATQEEEERLPEGSGPDAADDNMRSK